MELLSVDDRMERYQVRGRNGTIVIESNWSLFRARSLKHRPPNWRQIEGKPLVDHALQVVGSTIQQYMEKK